MRGILAVGAAVAATALVGQVARATLTVSLVQVPISSQAITADPTLGNARTFELEVTQSGEQFAVADLQMTLGAGTVGGNLSGSLYAPTGHQDTPLGVSSLSNGTGINAANLAYDTYFTTPQYGTTGTTLITDSTGGSSTPSIDIAGGADYPVSPAPAGAVTASNSTNTLNIVWGDHRASLANVSTSASYPIAQITVVGNTGAYLNGYVEGTVTSTPVTFHDLYLPILGDTNGDGVVGLADFNNVENHFGQNSPIGDTNADGIVGLADFNNVENNFSNSLAPSSSVALGTLVPEPASLGLLVLCGAGLIRRRRSA